VKGRLQCPFCGEATREHDLAKPSDIQWLTGLYLTHLVESHWPELGQLQATRAAQGGSYDAWKRL
jgi:hypothetical protein